MRVLTYLFTWSVIHRRPLGSWVWISVSSSRSCVGRHWLYSRGRCHNSWYNRWLNGCCLQSFLEHLDIGRLFDVVWQGVPTVDHPVREEVSPDFCVWSVASDVEVVSGTSGASSDFISNGFEPFSVINIIMALQNFDVWTRSILARLSSR